MTSTQRIRLSKSVLKKIVLGAFIMSGVDGHMDETEIEVILNFADQYWVDSLGDKEDFFKEVDTALNKILFSAKEKFELNDDHILDIISGLSLEEERVFLGLMTDVMKADGIIAPSEKSLIKLITDHMTRRN